MMQRREFATVDEVKILFTSLKTAAEAAQSAVRTLVSTSSALEVLEAIKFQRIGRDPLDTNRELNLIEQVNQTFTCLVTVRALEYLFWAHPESAPFRINPATAPGSDICSEDGAIAAECFAATHPGSNQKLKKDTAKVRDTTAVHRYVFFYCPGDHEAQELDGVKVIPLGLGNRDST